MTRYISHLGLKRLPAGERQYYCPEKTFPAETWLVKRQPNQPGLWLINEAEDARPWLVAATIPICPLCATNLVCLSLT